MPNFRKYLWFVVFAISAAAIVGCGGDDKDGANGVKSKDISGVSQKGPFLTGSTVNVQALDGSSFKQTGLSFSGNIRDDQGNFVIPSVTLDSPYARLSVNGYFRNEMTGVNTKSQVSMNAIADLSQKDKVNINVVTHLMAERVVKILTNNGGNGQAGAEAFEAAKKQAQTELLSYFHMNGTSSDAEDVDIFGYDDSSATLLAISLAVLGDLSEADFQERLMKISVDLEDGQIDNTQSIRLDMAKWALTADVDKIRDNMKKWDSNQNIPKFDEKLKTFWQGEFELSECNAGTVNQGKEIINNEDPENGSLYFLCKESGWESVSKTEYHGKVGGGCDEPGKIVVGDSVCDNDEIRSATSFERLVDRGCTSGNRNEKLSPEGFANKYVCSESGWATDVSATAGEFTDLRDSKKYKTVVIGNQTWMAENLRYQPASGTALCAPGDSGCAKDGAFYDWNTAQNACPEGWHLPTVAERDALAQFVKNNDPTGKVAELEEMVNINGEHIDSNAIVAQLLKSTDDWEYEDSEGKHGANGVDNYGFNVKRTSQFGTCTKTDNNGKPLAFDVASDIFACPEGFDGEGTAHDGNKTMLWTSGSDNDPYNPSYGIMYFDRDPTIPFNLAAGQLDIANVRCLKSTCDGGNVGDLDVDSANCGACGNKCDPGKICKSGSCESGAGPTYCGSVSIDISSDPANCGQCGKVCDGVCSGGSCDTSMCPSSGCFTNIITETFATVPADLGSVENKSDDFTGAGGISWQIGHQTAYANNGVIDGEGLTLKGDFKGYLSTTLSKGIDSISVQALCDASDGNKCNDPKISIYVGDKVCAADSLGSTVKTLKCENLKEFNSVELKIEGSGGNIAIDNIVIATN